MAKQLQQEGRRRAAGRPIPLLQSVHQLVLKNKICQYYFFGFSVSGELEGGGSILKINGIHSITLSPRPIIG
jgi:hypothetical protein